MESNNIKVTHKKITKYVLDIIYLFFFHDTKQMIMIITAIITTTTTTDPMDVASNKEGGSVTAVLD